MPEGPEIRRAADEVQAALKGHRTLEVWFGLQPLKSFERQLTGAIVTRVETHGKAMLTRFDNDLTIYSHNQLYGRWCTRPCRQLPETKRQLRLAIHNSRMSALLYSASNIQVLDSEQLSEHPFLSRLGPDLLAAETTSGEILERLNSKNWRNRRLGTLLTDQRFAAGLGNYLRCELLFLNRLHPVTRPSDCGQEQLFRLAESMTGLPRQSYATGGITNDLARAKALMNEGSSFEDARFHLFRRAGRPCYQCGTNIEKQAAGGQVCYICPVCQSARHK